MMPLLVALGDEEVLLIIGTPIVGGLVLALTAIITGHLRRSQRDDMEATLKMEMIQRGMSVDEIERVLAARIGRLSKHRRRHGGRYQVQHQYQHQQQQHGAPVAGR